MPPRPDAAPPAGPAGPPTGVSRPPADPAPPAGEGGAAATLRRFTRAERWVHRGTAWLMAVAIGTAAVLYLPELGELVGRRRLLVTVHEWSGVLLPLPLLAGLFFRALRADLGRLNRFGVHDWRWLSRVLRRVPGPHPSGKFNAGQKLYASFMAGAVLVMIGTGLILWFPEASPLMWRMGATFVHDWLALVIGVLVIGHILLALNDPEARRGLRTGRVSRIWARHEHPLWERENRPPER